MNQLKKVAKFLINALFPNSCMVCNKLVSHNYHTGVCSNCFKNTKFFNLNSHSELHEIIKKSYFDSFDSQFIYQYIIDKAILNFKFHDMPQNGKHLAKLMTNKISNLKINDALLVPVPIHSKRLITRKYNQASILAKSLSKLNNIKYSNKALLRIKNTPHQTGQNAKTRNKQLQDAFLANSKIVENKNIILIDDVFTTGSTVNLCAKELKEKGAKSVHVITIAYTEL